MLWFAILAAVGVGTWSSGWRAVHLARRGDIVGGEKALQWACVWAFTAGTGVASLVTGWPMKAVSTTVSEEVIQTVVETIEVPVQVTKWFFWTTTRMETRQESKQVVQTVPRVTLTKEVSLWLVFPLLFIGWLCAKVEKGLVRLAWGWSGLSDQHSMASPT